MNTKLSPIICEGYIIKRIPTGPKTTNHGAQAGYAFIVCHNSHALFGLGVKVFLNVEEHITEDIKKILLRLGNEEVCSRIKQNEFEEGQYYCYEWTPNNPLTTLREVNCNDEKWGMVGKWDDECAENDNDG